MGVKTRVGTSSNRPRRQITKDDDDDDAVAMRNVRGNVRERGRGEETRGGYGTRKL